MTHRLTTTVLATPVMPNLRGVGVEQRAGRTLDALGMSGPVDIVLCRPRWTQRLRGLRGGDSVPDGARSVSRSARVEPLPGEMLVRRLALGAPRSRSMALLTRAATRALPAATLIDPARRGRVISAGATRLHVFRLASAGVASQTRRLQRATIDLDDVESTVARDIARLARDNGDRAVAGYYDALARRLAYLEEQALTHFDQAWVASATDVAPLLDRVPGADVRVLPNVVDIPNEQDAPRSPGPVRFLYVGALAYYPNIDALRVLAERVLPRLSAMTRERFELHVVGRGAPRWLEKSLRARREIVFHGGVVSMAPHYAQADAVVVPLRAGGGTRIKLLEAFAHGVPVIATAMAAHGLEVIPQVHYLEGADEDALAEICARFVTDPEHAGDITAAASRFVRAHHSPPVFASRLNESSAGTGVNLEQA